MFRTLRVWWVCARGSLEAFIEVGKSGRFWEGGWRLGVERKLNFSLHDRFIYFEFSMTCMYCLPSIHTLKGRGVVGKQISAEKPNLP